MVTFTLIIRGREMRGPELVANNIAIGIYGIFAQRPASWLPCNQTYLYSSKVFPELFAIVERRYSAPEDPDDTFRLPDISEAFVFAGAEAGDPIENEVNPCSLTQQIAMIAA